MVKSIVGWFRGLFTPRTKAQGLSNEPTHSQVERLIEAAGGASAKGGSLYSKPTYSQFERLIAALGGGSGSGSGSVSGLPAKRDKLDLGVYDFMPETWEVSGSKALFSGGTYTWDDASSQWRLSNGQRAIRAKAGASNTYQLVFDPGTAGELTVCEWEGTAVQDVPFTHGGESWAVTVEGRGNAGLKPTGDTLARKSYVDASVAGTVDGAGYDAKYGNEQKPTILLKHGNRVVATVDATDFVVDGMVDDVYIGTATSGPKGTQDEDESGKLVIKFNTDAGNKVIRIPLEYIFNPDNYPTRSYVDTTFVEKGATNVLIGSGASKVNNVTNAVVIGVNASANGSTTSSAVAIGTEAKAKKTGAIQLGAGENSEEKSLQFRGTKVVGGDGKIPEASLHYVPALESVPEQTIAASTSYAVGAVVVDSGKAYRCKSAYTSAATPESPSVDTAHWTEVPVLAGKESASNKVTSLTSESTDEQYPSAKCVYDTLNGAGAKPTRLYNENGADALDDKGQLFDSVVETGGHWEVDVVDNMGYNTGHYVYTYVGIVNGMHRWSQGGSTSATDRNIQISGDQVSWYSQFRFEQKVTSGVDPTSTSGSESMAGTYTGSDSRHSVTAVYVPQRPQIQSDPYAHFALESLPDRTWVAGKWAVGDLVKHDGKAYRCKAAAKLSDTTAPSSDTTHWTEVPVLTGVTQLFAGRSLPQAPTQNEVAEVVKEIFKALGGTISTASSNEDNP